LLACRASTFKYGNATSTVVSRALSTVVGTLLLVALTVVAATTVGTVATMEPGSVPPAARLSLSADADTDRIALTHEGGDTLAVGDLSVTVSIDGQPLDEHPPVPFFAARGFRSGPTGPFNSASDDEWTAGETGAVRLAATNSPTLSSGDRVAVTVATDGAVVARLETRA
jgi:flagellin-like protein